MRRFLAILVVAIIAVSSFPFAAQARLVCRMTGLPMQPVSVAENPHSCCAIKAKASGGMELANRSCCDLQIRPGHAPLPDATLAHVGTTVAALPTISFTIPIPVLFEMPLTVTLVGVPQYRGPPPSSASPRAPPVFS